MANELKLEIACDQVLGLTSRRYRQLADEGVVPKPIKGKIDILLACKLLLDYYRKGKTDKITTLQDEKIRIFKVQADMKELQFKREMGQLVDAEEVRREYFGRARAVRDGVLNMFDRVDPLLAAEKNRKKRYQIFLKEVSHILGELAVESVSG